MSTPLPPDPFDVPPSVPALSFKDAPVGTSYVGQVTQLPTLVQQRDFETNEAAVWPDGNPKMAAVFHIKIGTEERSVWCPKPSSLFAAVVDAQTANKQRMMLGDTVQISFIGEKPNETNPRLNAAKQYAVRITPLDPFAGAQAAAEAAAQVPPAPPAPPVQPTLPLTPVAPPAPVAPPVGIPQPGVAPAASGSSLGLPPDQAIALLGQIRTLVGFGLSDEQIRTTIPAATPDVLAAVRSIPV